MARSTAMRIRIDLAIPMDLSDMTSVMAASNAIEDLKDAAIKAGFVFTDEISPRAGSYDFGGEGDEKAPDAEDAAE